jgi:hypothetical protein
MSSNKSYREWLNQDLGSLIDAIDLTDLQKHFMHSRWLDQVLWMEGKADSAQKRYNLFRLSAIIGGVIVPALVSLNICDEKMTVYIRWVTFAISLVVAISVAVEGFFQYGERWRHYRRTVESLKVEGWQFFQLSGLYQNYENHAEAYPVFAGRVEDIHQQEFEIYITKVVREKEKEEIKNP